MLIFLVSVIPFFLHLFGFHCDSNKQVQTTNALDFVENLKIAFQDPKETFNSSKYTPYKMAGIQDCTVYVRQVNGNLYYTCNDGNTSGCAYALLYVPKVFSDVPACVNATNYSNIAISNSAGTMSQSADPYVFSDAFRIADADLNWFRQVFSCNSDCIPPEHYYWNHLDNTFTCQDTSVCGINNTKITYKIDVELKSADGKRLYSDVQKDKDYKSAVKISCNGDFQPNITVFKIPVFDYKLWLLLMVVGLLFFFLNKINVH